MRPISLVVGASLAMVAAAAFLAAPSEALAAADCAAVAGNLVQNCGFESPVVGAGTYANYPAGSAGITGWTVASTGGGTDLVDRRFSGTYPVHSGDEALDLNHDDAGGVYQDIATTNGSAYLLSFYLSGYPAASAGCTAADPKSVTVTAGSASPQTFTFTPNASASPAGAQSFSSASLIFAATSVTTRVTFTSNTTGCAGPIIDDVSIQSLATSVTFRSVSAATAKHGCLVRWRTGSELGTLGFNVYRDVNGRRVRANQRLIPAARRGGYSYLDRAAPRISTLRYWIQVVNLDGSRTWYGPASVRRDA